MEARRRESARAVRPQAHVHLIEPAGRRMHGEQMHDALSQAQEEDAVVERPLALRLLNFSARIVQEDQIEIRAITQLQASQLAVTRDGDAYRAQIPLLAAAKRGAVNVGHLLPREILAALNDELGNIG